MFNRINGVIGAVALTGALVASTAQADITLRWGHYLCDSAFLQVEKDFAATVEERTEGRVKIEITFAGGLGKGNEIMTLARRGAIDMAAVVPGYYSDQLLFWRAYQIPFVFENPAQAMQISAAAYKDLPYFEEELDKFNIKFLFHQPLGDYFLTGPDANCDSVAGLSGKKIRSFGADVPKAHEAVGAVPVSVGVGDVYEALQNGSLDYSFLNRGNILANRLYEPGKYSCGPIMAITGHLLVINKDRWAEIDPADQEIMLQAAQEAGKAYIDAVGGAEEAAGEKIVAAGGVIKPFPAEELAKWKAAAPDLLQNWVDDMESRGMGDAAKEVAAYWRKIIDG